MYGSWRMKRRHTVLMPSVLFSCSHVSKKTIKKTRKTSLSILYCEIIRQDICHSRKENVFVVQTESFFSPPCILVCVTKQLIKLTDYTKWLTKQATQVTNQTTNQLISNIAWNFRLPQRWKSGQVSGTWRPKLGQFFRKKKLRPAFSR